MLKEKTFEFDELSNWLAIHPNITNVSILDGSLIVEYETSDELIGMEGKQYQVMTEDGDLHEGTVVDGEWYVYDDKHTLSQFDRLGKPYLIYKYRDWEERDQEWLPPIDKTNPHHSIHVTVLNENGIICNGMYDFINEVWILVNRDEITSYPKSESSKIKYIGSIDFYIRRQYLFAEMERYKEITKRWKEVKWSEVWQKKNIL